MGDGGDSQLTCMKLGRKGKISAYTVIYILLMILLLNKHMSLTPGRNRHM